MLFIAKDGGFVQRVGQDSKGSIKARSIALARESCATNETTVRLIVSTYPKI